jgi:hypothetical protein
MYVGISKSSWKSSVKLKYFKCSTFLSKCPQSTSLLQTHSSSIDFAMLASTLGNSLGMVHGLAVALHFNCQEKLTSKPHF